MNRISNSQKSRGISSIIEQYSMTTNISKGDRLYNETKEIMNKLTKVKQQKENKLWARDIDTIKSLHWQLDRVLYSLALEGYLFYIKDKDYKRILRLITSFNEYITHNQLWKLKYSPLPLDLHERMVIV
tara:strand:- start:158 stop:544 length:387 start_codon:yes stop_codon:yes gene_type:complete